MKPLMIEPSRVASWYAEFEDNPALEVAPSTAILPIYGFLTKRPGPFMGFGCTTSYDEIQAQLKAALDDPLITHIILDIDSPGGEVNGLFDLCDVIYAARSQKTIEAIANDDAFSAAYAIASSAQKVWCTRTSGLGSIGVIATHCDQSQLDHKNGLTITPIFAGKHKNDLSPHAPLSEEALSSTQAEMDRLYALFIETVARNRGLSKQAVQATEAALFFGSDAICHKLADGLCTLQTLITPSPSSSYKVSPICSTPAGDHSPRRLSMDTNENTATEVIADEAPPQEVPPQEASPQEEEPQTHELPVQEAPTAAANVAELVKLCKIANRPELLVHWLDRNMTVAQAQASLLKEMEAQPMITTAHFQHLPPENPLIQAAKNRTQH